MPYHPRTISSLGRKSRKLTTFYKMHNKVCPQYLPFTIILRRFNRFFLILDLKHDIFGLFLTFRSKLFHNETVDGIKDVKHYLMECPLCQNEGYCLFRNLRETNKNIETLLFGNDEISISENSNIFNKVRAYIRQTTLMS
jgi:hypothetical protein